MNADAQKLIDAAIAFAEGLIGLVALGVFLLCLHGWGLLYIYSLKQRHTHLPAGTLKLSFLCSLPYCAFTIYCLLFMPTLSLAMTPIQQYIEAAWIVLGATPILAIIILFIGNFIYRQIIRSKQPEAP